MNKVAFITGAGGYIGGETAVTLAKQGINIAVCDINQESIKKTIEKIEEIGGIAKGYIIDVTDSKSVDDVAGNIFKDFGRLDIMVHIAGGSARIAGKDAKYVPLVEQEDYVIDRVLKVNLYGAFYASRAAARIMIKQGEGGKIINFSSAVGINGLKNCCDYAASKGGVISFTKSLAKELGPYKINVNSVAPGVVMRPEEQGGDERALNTNLLGEKCYASDIANLVEFLTSDKARFITGQTYVCDGGRTLSMKGTD
ncbi:MAG: SDR family NAD(P)-dependent oxidoreductase [Clostridia bacterium]|nr:SDR family NAD(P)-dependent oxidoreductase [Clostridia bacterium]